MSKKTLGKGIEALLGEVEKAGPSPVTELLLSALSPNPEQPRREFADASLQELADSIREKGILQPILAEPHGDGTYIIVAGERRVRAARLAGLSKIPVVVREFTEHEKLEIALIENVQREDLTPIEEARAYRRLMDLAGLSQEQVAMKVGKERSTIANSLRLLKLPEEAQEALAKGSITAGHARALLMLVNPADQRLLLGRMVDAGISVREAESMAGSLNKGKKGSARPARSGVAETGSARREPEIREIEQRLIEKLGTKVEVKGSARKGRIEISYFSSEDLERLLDLLA
ncbi:MAG TPA: ParB/RepB/Spo0J family partition protein [Spirochaetia bacterium]|nr:ParB/RepB/Spo0J family partition protein [Spirochaetia bacterium]